MNKKVLSAVVVLVALFGLGYFGGSRVPVVPTGRVQLNAVTFSCDNNKTIDAVFYDTAVRATQKEGEPPVPGGSVDLAFNDGRAPMTLAQSISADGARYANKGESFVFWNKGNGVMVLENDKENNYTGCIVLAPGPEGSTLTRTYSNSKLGFSARLFDGYTVDASYQYQMTPDKSIAGVKFTIPASLADGTNLAHDTYISEENLPAGKRCTADQFLYDKVTPKEVTENGTTYSYAFSMGAGAGNRYEETVYALAGSNPCKAIRYFVHYGVIENYPPGAVKEFDKKKLLAQFDEIRRTLVFR